MIGIAAEKIDALDLVVADSDGNLVPDKKPRRTAVERAAESLEKAKAKARARLLKLAWAKLHEAITLLDGAGGISVHLPQGCDMGTVDAGIILCDIHAAIHEELGE